MRLAMLVVALALVAAGCGLADPVTKSRTDSVRGAAWQWAETDQVALESAPIAHTITPAPTPTPTGGPFLPAFQPQPARTPASEPFALLSPGPIYWPIAPPDEPVFEELDHTPEPEPSQDPCDAVGLLPDECAPEPDPCDDCEPPGCDDPDADACQPDCDETGSECTPPDCDDSAADDGEQGDGGTDPPADDTGNGEPGDGEATETPEPTPTPTPTAESTESPEPTPTPEPTDSPAPPCPPSTD